jgi:hypothetical protein
MIARAVALLLLVAALVASAAEARAQGVSFQPAKQLPGFEQAQLGPDADLWKLAEFEALEGKSLAPAELAAVKQKWDAERQRVAGELEKLQADPVARSRRRLARKLAAHPFFSKIELGECADFPPLLFLVQRPPKAEPGWERKAAESFAPWLLKAIALFEKELAGALPEARREGHAFLPIALLCSDGDFANFWSADGSWDYAGGGSSYCRDLHLAVTHRSLVGAALPEADARKGALYGVMRSEIASYSASEPSSRPEAWVREGLARAFASHGGSAAEPTALDPDPKAFARLGGYLQDERVRDGFFLPVAELLAIRDWEELFVRAEKRGAQPPDPQGRPDAWAKGIFQSESQLLAWWLLREEDGRRKSLLVRALADHLGTTAKDAAPGSPTKPDSAELQKGMVEFLARECAKGGDAKPLAPELVRQLAVFDGAGKVAGSGAGPAGTKPGAAPAAPVVASKVLDPNFRMESLLELPLPLDARIGMALLRAAGGDLEGARADCEAAGGAGASDPMAARAGRDAARLAELAEAKRDLFDRCRTDRKKVKLELGSAVVAVSVQERDGETLVVADSKGKVSRVKLAAIGCDELLKKMSELKLETGSAAARAYAALLAGRKNWAKAAAGATPEEQALREDGEKTAALLETGKAARRLTTLAALPLPQDGAAGESLFDVAKALLVEQRDEPIVIARSSLLRSAAAYALAPQFEARGLASAGVHGKVEPAGEGRVRVTWSFEKAEEAQDWAPATFPANETWRDKLKTDEKDAFVKVDGGAVKAHGRRYWGSKLQFSAPLTVEFTYLYEPPAGESDEYPFSAFGVCFCDDGKGNRISTMDMAGIRIHAGRDFAEDYAAADYDFEIPYAVRVVHDGAKATLSCGEYPPRSIAAKGCTSGTLGLLFYTDTVLDLKELSVEGKLAPASLVPMRDAWLEQELGRLDAAGAPKR